MKLKWIGLGIVILIASGGMTTADSAIIRQNKQIDRFENGLFRPITPQWDLITETDQGIKVYLHRESLFGSPFNFSFWHREETTNKGQLYYNFVWQEQRSTINCISGEYKQMETTINPLNSQNSRSFYSNKRGTIYDYNQKENNWMIPLLKEICQSNPVPSPPIN